MRDHHFLRAGWGLGLAIAWLAGCKAGSQQPAVHYTRSDWDFKGAAGSKLTSEHYVLFTTVKSAPFVEALPGFMESCWTSYEKLVPPINSATQCEAYMFGSRGQWERFTEEFTPDRA